MRRLILNQKGSILLVLIMTLSVIILLFYTLLEITVKNHKMKKINSEVKKTHYLAEAGAEEAYIITRNFINNAIFYAVEKTEEFENQNYSIKTNLSNDEINLFFKNVFKNFLKGHCTDINPSESLVEVLNREENYYIYEQGFPKIEPKLFETNEGFSLEVKSVYIRNNIKKGILVKYDIKIPDYFFLKNSDDFRIEDILELIEWKIEN